MKTYQDGGAAILDAFRALGIDHIFSSPGSEWSPVWEALARQRTERNSGPDFIESWHETLAVTMASGYTMVTGRPQAVLLHAGVGLLQGAMGIQAALQSEVPMLVMSGESVSLGEDPDLPIEPQWYGGLSPGGAERLVERIVKWGSEVASPAILHESVIRAGEMAQRVPKGPVYLDVPLEHMLQGWTPPERPRQVPPAPRLEASAEAVAEVAALLAGARNPVIVVEAAGRDPAAFSALVDLAELMALPVIGGRSTTYANFPVDHPLWLGIGSYQHLAEADLVLLVSGRAPWYPAHRRPTAGRIVLVHENPIKAHMVYQNLHAETYLEGDVAASLRRLAGALRGTADAAAVAARRRRWAAEHDSFTAGLRATEAEAAAAPRIDAVALAAALAATLPPDTIYVDETITHHATLRQHLGLVRAQSFFRVSGGLGQGMGVALGVKLAAPERPVVLLVGDGGFLYNPIVQALGAAQRHGLPILAVVLNNGAYEAMRRGHIQHYPDGVARSADLWHGVDIAGPNYEELGAPFGCRGRRVERPDDLPAALREALGAVRGGRMTILNVILGS